MDSPSCELSLSCKPSLSMDPPSSSRWSNLPMHLVEVISSKIKDIADFIRFRCICKSWRSAVSPSNFRSQYQIPWLLLPYDVDGSTRSFVDHSTKSIYNFDLQTEALNQLICGSSNGWLVMLHTRTLRVSLLNPITRARVEKPCPLFHLVAFLKHHTPGYYVEYIKCYALIRGKDSMLACFLNAKCRRRFVYCRLEDEDWTTVDTELSSNIRCLTYHNGKFYIVSSDGEIAVCDVSSSNTSVIFQRMKHYSLDTHYYFVQRGEDLLLVVQDSLHPVCVYKLEDGKEGTELKFIWMDDVGDSSIFFVPGMITTVAASDSSRNCNVYWHRAGQSEVPCIVRRRLHDFENEETFPLPWLCPLPPIWFSPRLC